MSEDPLHRILQEADRQTAPPVLSAEMLIEGVHRSARRRRIVRVTYLCAALILVITTVRVLLRSREPTRTPDVPDRARLVESPSELELLEAEVNRLQSDLKLLVLKERKRQLQSRLATLAARPDPLEEIDLARSRAAQTMVCHGNQLERRLGRPALALETYRQVDALFPETTWAGLARNRIRELQDL